MRIKGINKIKCILLLPLLSLSVSDATAQYRLVLIKKDEIFKQFLEGDKIRLKEKFHNSFTAGIITNIARDYIVLKGHDTVYVNHISKVDMHGSKHRMNIAEAGTKLMMAGGLLMIAETYNRQYSPGTSTGIIVASSTLFGSGLLMQFFNNNYFKAHRKRK